MFVLFSLTLVLPALAVKNAPNVTLVASDLSLCNNGTIELNYTICPTGWSAGALPAAPASAIEGWTAVTQPLDATGTGIRVDVGGGNNDLADLSTLDTATLTAGSVVNIFYRAQAYSSKLTFFTDGSETNPIRIHGVTDGSGNQPVIECAGATNVTPARWSTDYSMGYGCWVLAFTRESAWNVPANDGPSWYEFSNITIQGAHPDNTYDSAINYVSGAAGIRIANGTNFKFEGMRFLDNSNGLFSASNYVIENVEIRGSHFSGNGQVGSYLEHNVYLQAVGDSPHSIVFEGNTMGPLRTGALGLSGGKFRGTDLVYRYNNTICWQRCLDIVEAQDELPSWIYTNFSAQEIIDRYRTSYVYGNTFKINGSLDWVGAYGIHCGMDTGQGEGNGQVFHSSTGPAAGEPMARCAEGGVMHFYHNTVHADASVSYRNSFFDFDAASNGESLYTGRVVAANNVWQYLFSGGAHYMQHAQYSGDVTYVGVNHANIIGTDTDTIYEGSSWDDDPTITITGDSSPTFVATFTSGGDPLFTIDTGSDPLGFDLSPQAGSPIIGASGTLSAAMQAFPVLLQPNLPSLGGGALTRSATTNLGAFE
jgi:hypothetical protein